MNYKKIAGYLVLLLAFVGLARAGLDIYGDLARGGNHGAEAVTAGEARPPEGTGELVIYFFEGNTPCSVCDKIRGMTLDLVKSDPEQLSLFSFRDVNVEEKGNEKYVLELGLFSTSVVLAQESGGKIYRWKNLTGVWDLAADPGAFRDYMLREIDSFLSEGETR